MVAALDVGSNTIHLLVAAVAGRGLVARRHAVVLARLGRTVAATGRLGPEAIETASTTVAELVTAARGAGAATVVLAATEAVRRAADRSDLVDAVRARCGLGLRVLTGEEEARLSFLGATAARGAAAGEVAVFDCGGASTEVVLGSGPRIRTAMSLPIGSDALIQRHAFGDPPSPAERAAAAAAVDRILATAPRGDPGCGVATGGTAANLPALLGRRLPPTGEGSGELGPPLRDEPVALSLAQLAEAQAVTDRRPSAQVAAATGLHPDRARLLAGGTQLLLAIAHHYRLAALTVTERGLRDGLLIEALGWTPADGDLVP